MPPVVDEPPNGQSVFLPCADIVGQSRGVIYQRETVEPRPPGTTWDMNARLRVPLGVGGVEINEYRTIPGNSPRPRPRRTFQDPGPVSGGGDQGPRLVRAAVAQGPSRGLGTKAHLPRPSPPDPLRASLGGSTSLLAVEGTGYAGGAFGPGPRAFGEMFVDRSAAWGDYSLLCRCFSLSHLS